LLGGKIQLVKFTDEFITEEYISWLNDPKINKYLYVGRMPVNKIINPNSDTYFLFAIIENENKKHIGNVSFNKIDWIDRKAEIGYIIGDKNFWGKGIATEVVELITHWGFNRLNMHKIEAGVVDGNTGSIKALEKNGFKQYGIIPEDYFINGKYYNTVRFYKLQEWL
jgi:RimJ/RimL family protein N-acetyltransferase